MTRIEKTVFISYRRTNLPWALAIYQNLTANGFDVFFDYNSIRSGDFEQIITQNIKGRAHFIALLTPSALERCNEPGDWLRYEIELAITEKRNIVPLFFEGFSFSNHAISKYLTGKLTLLKQYNGMTVPSEYFEAAMMRLRNDFLDIPLSAVLHPISINTRKAVKEQQAAANNATKVQTKELTAQEWVEQGIKYSKSRNNDEAVRCFTEAIRLNPDYAKAYFNRGNRLSDKGDLDGAIKDYTEAIRLDPNYASAYNNRGNRLMDKGDLDGAIKDYTEAIRLDPNNVNRYLNRGNCLSDKGDLDGAIKDYTEAIRLDPNNVDAYLNRGDSLSNKGNTNGAIRDYTEAIRLDPNNPDVYINRGISWEEDKSDYYSAIADYQKYIDLGGERKEVIDWINEIKKKIK